MPKKKKIKKKKKTKIQKTKIQKTKIVEKKTKVFNPDEKPEIKKIKKQPT